MDIEEWRYKGESNADFLEKISKRLQKKWIPDNRGKNMAKVSLQNTEHTELVLFHDRDVTNEFFQPIIEQLIAMNVDFKPFVFQ